MTPGLALLPLRLFLGATFVYAGIQKLSDGGFLVEGSGTYIGTQLEAFADGTPGGWLLRTFALPMPEVAGVGVAVTEIAVGLLAVLGLRTRLAAGAGLGLSLVLFLTASWHTKPYFLGSDIVFAFAWLPFVLVGAEGQPALDHRPARAVRLVRRGRVVVPSTGAVLTRRAALLQALGFAGAASALVAGVSVLLRGRAPAPATAAAAGEAVGDAAALAPGEGLSVLRVDGTPALVVRSPDGALKAYDATCTHQGCEVEFRSGEIRCPCHHARFDPGTGEPVAGPARLPLGSVRVSERGGRIVLG
jgi:thiosulfate dehydrogenase [quinone] large subunit